jgi:putative FmdB family regulatory protein
MPTYDYQCQECGHTFEVRATISQKAAGLKPECPECHSQDTRQAFRSVNFIGHSSSGEPAPMPVSGCGPLCGPGSC